MLGQEDKTVYFPNVVFGVRISIGFQKEMNKKHIFDIKCANCYIY